LQGKIAAGNCAGCGGWEQSLDSIWIDFEQANLVLVNLQKSSGQGFAWSEHVAVKKEFRRTGWRLSFDTEYLKSFKSEAFAGFMADASFQHGFIKADEICGVKKLAIFIYRKLFSIETGKYKRIRG